MDVQDLGKEFHGRWVLRDVNFTVREGEILGFLGPNGAGKTTTMRIITGYLPPSVGKVKVAGYDVTENPLEVKRRIGYLPESPPIYRELTVKEYLKFVMEIKDVPRNRRKERLSEVIEYCGLKEVYGRLIGNLSRGYRQRVALAQALISDPDLLILDEPTSGLDAVQIVEIRSLIKSLKGRHTVILSTHILPEVTATCDRVIIISNGRIAAEDTLEGLEARLRPSKKVEVKVARYRDKVSQELSKLPSVISVVPSRDDTILIEYPQSLDLREDIARVVVGLGAGLLELKPVSMTLEEVFLQLVTEEEAGRA
ncbi:MAG: ABC transporter ATP-binding protein [Synergistetes bacterium]|nr:ABC transporter ATP-binding protein [Synergistota bacterium]MCX8127616.1 ABC transporter ATP-binding protein [Synergistota bacterium]MDW8191467.1 ATP-binding cassette domain-containing protein [Synergistota bacterium]